MIYKILFFICNIIFLFQNHYITNKTLSSIVAILSIAGIIFSLVQSHIKTQYKFVISLIYIVSLIIYLIFTYV
jgi:hypothetical protein